MSDRVRGGGRGGSKGGRPHKEKSFSSQSSNSTPSSTTNNSSEIAAAMEKLKLEEEAKKQAEAEAKREAEIVAKREAADAAAAAKIAAEQHAERQSLKAKYDEDVALWKARLALREANIAASKASVPFEPSAKMDSSIKKCAGYINKLKLLQQHTQESLLKELQTVTLHKYVSEVVTTLLDLRFTKSIDLFKALHVASIMHQRHGTEEFTQNLVQGLVKVFDGQKTTWKRAQQERQNVAAQIAASGGASNTANAAQIAATTQTPAEIEEEKNQTSRKRYTMRFMTELFLCGLTTDLKPLLGVLSDLLQSDTRNEPDLSNTVIQLLNSWLKYAGEPILACNSIKQSTANKAAELPVAVPHPEFLTQPQREQVLNKLFLPYSKQMHERLLGVHTALQKLEKRAARIQMMRGQIPLDMLEERRGLREQMTALQAQVETYYDLLGLQLDPLPDIQDAEDEMFSLVSLESSDASALDSEGNLGPWDDSETKRFYEDLVDLTVVVPPLLLSDGNDKEKARLRREQEKKAGASAEDATAEDETDEPSASPSAASSSKDRKRQDEDDSYVGRWDMTIADLEARVASKYKAGTLGQPSSQAGGKDGDYVDSIYEEDADGNPIVSSDRFLGKEKRSHPMEALLSEISTSLNREAIDACATKFCYLNTKNNRLRLVEAIYTLSRNKIDEIPYWCRFLATLSKNMSNTDMAEEIIELFTREFYRLLRNKSQYRIESKIRNIRFISELVKFKVAEPILIFKCWHALLLSFNTNSIQLISLLLEYVGRWLYRTPATHIRTASFLERTMLLKEQKYLDRSLALQLENAYLHVKPPPVSEILTKPKKVRTPIHEFIRKTLYVDLNPRTAMEVVVRRLRQLNWNEPITTPPDESHRVMVIKTLSNVCNVAYGNISSLALVASILHKYHQVGYTIVDNILEEIRVGLEMNRFSQNQRRITYIHYLGELYLYKLVDSQVIFDTLYLMITFGHEVDAEGKLFSKIDPPSDTFRIRLIITLLEVIGTYFDHGLAKRRMDRFLIYFQRYLFLKEIVPIDLEFAVQDLLDRIRPNFVRAASLEEVQSQIAKLESSTDHSMPDRLFSLTAQVDDGIADTPGASRTPNDSDMEDGDLDDDEKDEEEVVDGEEKEGEADSYASRAAASLVDAAAAALAEEDEDGEDDDSFGEDDSDEEDDAFDRGAQARKTREELEFQAEYDRMMADSVENAKFQPRNNTMATVEAVTAAAGLSETRANVPFTTAVLDGEDHAVFRFLSRNAKKQTTSARSLYIPAESDMVTSTALNQAQQAREKEEQKRLVLKGIERTEREQLEEERSATAERLKAEKAERAAERAGGAPFTQGTSQSNTNTRGPAPNESSQQTKKSSSGNSEKSTSLNRVGMMMGVKKQKEDLSLKLEDFDFAFAGSDTRTPSRVTLQGLRPSHGRK